MCLKINVFYYSSTGLGENTYILYNGKPNYPLILKDAETMSGSKKLKRTHPFLLHSLDDFVSSRKFSQESTQNFLRDFLKKKENEEILRTFSIKQHFGNVGFYDDPPGSSRFYHDAPYSFILQYNKENIALVSFNPEEKAILVNQIQGKKGAKEQLSPLRWERALLNLTEQWARVNNIPEVRVLPHHRSKWAEIQSRGKLRYDVTARRSGFKYDQEMDVYRKILFA